MRKGKIISDKINLKNLTPEQIDKLFPINGILNGQTCIGGR